MRDWLVRPENMPISIVWGPMTLALVMGVVLGVRHFKQRRSLRQMLVWLLPLGVGLALYWGWLFEVPPAKLTTDSLMLSLLIVVWVIGLDRAVASRIRQRPGSDAAQQPSAHASGLAGTEGPGDGDASNALGAVASPNGGAE